jgi:hypothetical protein
LTSVDLLDELRAALDDIEPFAGRGATSARIYLGGNDILGSPRNPRSARTSECGVTENHRVLALSLCLALVVGVLTYGVVAPRPTCSYIVETSDTATQYDGVPCAKVDQLRARAEKTGATTRLPPG